MRRSLVFDFDGTLADTRPHIIRLFNSLASRYAFGSLDPDDPELRDLGMRQLLARLGVPIALVPLLVRDVRDEMRALMPSVRPFAGMVEALHDLSAAGVVLGIVTSNERHNVDEFKSRHGLPSFAAVVTGSSLFGKARLLRKVTREIGGASGVAFYVGDESRDIEAAREAGVGAIGVTWGFNSHRHLAQLVPDFLVDRPSELLEVVPARSSASVSGGEPSFARFNASKGG